MVASPTLKTPLYRGFETLSQKSSFCEGDAVWRRRLPRDFRHTRNLQKALRRHKRTLFRHLGGLNSQLLLLRPRELGQWRLQRWKLGSSWKLMHDHDALRSDDGHVRDGMYVRVATRWNTSWAKTL